VTTILAFLAALALLIAVHEWGHYRVARACGVKVLRFSIGFGHVIWRRVGRNGTEFTLSALPLGGYVRMLDERDGTVVAPHEREQAFNRRPLRQRAAIVAAGPAANWVLAIVLFAAVAWLGSEQPKAVLGTPATGSVAERAGLRAGDWVRQVSVDGQEWQDVDALPDLMSAVVRAQALGENLHLSVSDAQGHGSRSLRLETERLAGRSPNAQLFNDIGLVPFTDPVIREVKPGPGADAGLQANDRVLSIDGRAVPDAGFLRDAILQARDGDQPRAMSWRVERAGQVVELQPTARLVADGDQRVARLDIGIGAPPERVFVSYGLVDGLWRGVQQSWDMAATTVRLLGRMLVGEASIKNLSGPLTIADYAGQSAKAGLAPYLDFLAKISMSLAVLNLLPLPMLDGGHLMYHLFEGLSGRPVSEWWQRQLQRAGALILMLMMALALSNDVARFAGWH
jgi:regulator of sigma E protease